MPLCFRLLHVCFCLIRCFFFLCLVSVLIHLCIVGVCLGRFRLWLFFSTHKIGVDDWSDFHGVHSGCDKMAYYIILLHTNRLNKVLYSHIQATLFTRHFKIKRQFFSFSRSLLCFLSHTQHKPLKHHHHHIFLPLTLSLSLLRSQLASFSFDLNVFLYQKYK